MKNHVSSVWGICGGVCSIASFLGKSPYLFITPRVFFTMAIFQGLFFNGIYAQQCPVPPFSNESEVFTQGLSTTIARTTSGFYIWGDSGSPNAESLAIPRKVEQDPDNENGYNFQGDPLLMTLGDVNQIDGSPQIVLLTSFGLYVWGNEGGVVRNADVTLDSYIQTPNIPGAVNGLPNGVNPQDVVQMCASSQVLALLTNTGDVWMNAYFHKELLGDGSVNADIAWHQANINDVALVKVNERTVFAVTESGDFYTWGREVLLADGNGYSAQNSPQLMTSPFPGIAPSSIAITNGKDSDEKTSYYALNPVNQKIYALGDNDMGQLGIGNEEIQFNWVTVQKPDNTGDLENVSFLAASDNGPGHPAVGAITENGTPYFWGDNNNSMLTGDALANPFYNLPRVPDGFIEGTDFATYIGVSGNSIMVKKFGVERTCFAGFQTNGNVGDGTDINLSQSISALQCDFPTLPNPDDYCFNTTESELVTTKTVSDENPKEEDTIFYILQVTNNGLGAASNVRVTDMLPAGITFTGTQNATGGSVNTYDENTGLWQIGDLAVDETASIEIVFQVNPGTTGLTITNILNGPAIADNFIDITTVGDDLDAEFTVQVDTDGDGVTDFDENDDGTNPNDYCSFDPVNVSLDPSPGFLADDCDGDGVSNGDEAIDNTNIFDFCDFSPLSVSLPQSLEFLSEDCDGDGFKNGDDCEPQNPNINPDTVWYLGLDGDGDGYFGSGLSATQCESPGEGYSTTPLTIDDCDDNDANVNPGTIEVSYNGIDDDCNPNTPDDDIDNDGFNLDVDCNDNNPNVNPNAVEIPLNGIDDDCNPNTLDDHPTEDLDEDGFESDVDCDDNNPAINPLAVEIPYNGIDDDCNPFTPDNDLDGDGFDNTVDCNDANADVNPDVAEILFNNIDDDCNPDTPDEESEPFEIEIEVDNALIGPLIDSGFFRILNIEFFPNNTVEIFNRWGVRVFETKGYDNGENNFRGISNGRGTLQPNAKLPAGVYFYVITYFKRTTPQQKVGYLYVQN